MAPRVRDVPPLTAAAVLVLVEALVVGALAVYGALSPVLRSDSGTLAIIETEAGLGFAVTALLVLAARALPHAARWARTPVVLSQLLALPVAVSLLQSDLPAYGIPLLLLALAVLVLVLAVPEARAPYQER